MGISFPTHLARASGSQFHKLGTVLKKNPTDSEVFLEASSYEDGCLRIGLKGGFMKIKWCGFVEKCRNDLKTRIPIVLR